MSEVSCFRGIKSPSVLVIQKQKSRLGASFWGNYKSDGKREGNIGLAIAVLLCIKGNFMSIDVRRTYMCPSGAGSEIAVFMCLLFSVVFGLVVSRITV